ncbi:MAG: protein-glutamate O-methyltransferase CheR [Planctomycetota bacterium]
MPTNDKDLQQLLQKVFEERGFDFRQYKMSMLKRRMERRLTVTRSESYIDYAKLLDSHPEEYKKLFDDLTINVSRFFRNPLTFELIYKVVLPDMIEYKQISMDNMIRIWSAGCANGEEPYSVAILLAELLGKQLKNYNITIYATDIDTDALNDAKTGIYSGESVAEVKKGLLDKYFHFDGNYRIKEHVKELVDFSYHDLTSEKFIAPTKSVFVNFDLILCRNVLIYFSRPLQDKVFNNFTHDLNKKGYLILGEAETLPDDFKNDFVCGNNLSKIYQKIKV